MTQNAGRLFWFRFFFVSRFVLFPLHSHCSLAFGCLLFLRTLVVVFPPLIVILRYRNVPCSIFIILRRRLSSQSVFVPH